MNLSFRPRLLAVLAAVPLLAACASMAPEGPPALVSSVPSPWVRGEGAPAETQLYSDYLSARFARLSGDAPAASRFYGRTVVDLPPSPGLLEQAIQAKLLAGDFDGAVRLALSSRDRITEQGADLVPLSDLVLAANEINTGQCQAAAERLAGARGPFNRVLSNGLRAWAYECAGMTAEAEMVLRGVGRNELLSGLSLYTKAFILLSRKDDAAALEAFEGAWNGGIRLAVGADAYARLLANAGRKSEALALLDLYLDGDSSNPALERTRDQIVSQRKVAVPRLNPRQGAALAIYTPTVALSAHADSDFLVIYLGVALGLDETLDPARLLIANALETEGQPEGSLYHLRAVPDTSPYAVIARTEEAWTLRRLERNDEALAVAQQALKDRPGPELLLQLGDLYRSLEQFDQAEALFDQGLNAGGAEGDLAWRFYYARGTARDRIGRWEEAETDLLKALELRPDQPEILNYLGYTWVDRGDNLEQAFDMIQRAVALRPDAGYIVDSLGWAYYRLGRYDKAVEYLERAVELSPEEATINDHLGDAYWRVGRMLEARFQWQRVLTLEPTPDVDLLLVEQKIVNGLNYDNGTPTTVGVQAENEDDKVGHAAPAVIVQP
jgi:tetratricopeptide (TPR) repeat protein